MIQSYETEVDLLIGEEELTGRGLGAQILSQFVEEEMSGDVIWSVGKNKCGTTRERTTRVTKL